MYLRETKRTNRDGSRGGLLAVAAHNERHPDTVGARVAKVIHNFGRAEQVDRDALARLVSRSRGSSRPSGPPQLRPGGVRHRGLPPARWGLTLDRLWEGSDRRGDPSGRDRPATGWEAVERSCSPWSRSGP